MVAPLAYTRVRSPYAQKDTAIVTTKTFADLGLAEPLMRALADTGYTIPTPIQAQAIPSLLEGRDLLGLAETGTGKTAAFALPILHRLAADPKRAKSRSARALILAPTRELAIQIADSFKIYGRHLRLQQAVVFGGVGMRPQIEACHRGLDILVATPGRLLDLIGERHLSLGETSILVLDEADRMLDMGFIRDVQRIVKMVPKIRQSLLFSATMPNDIESLAAELLHNAVKVEIARAGKTVDRIEQRVHFVENSQKRAALAALLQDPQLQRVIVFTRTKRGADRVARNLSLVGIAAHAIHGNKSQNARQSALESFRKGATRVLIATDIASRGIDIDDISHVINYELPNIPESYVHRIGRTARAGTTGIAIALCAGDERAYLRDIERLTRQPLTVAGAIPGMEQFAAESVRETRANFERPQRRDDRRGRPNGPRRDAHGERNSERRDEPRDNRESRGPRPEHRARHERPRHYGERDTGRGDRDGVWSNHGGGEARAERPAPSAEQRTPRHHNGDRPRNDMRWNEPRRLHAHGSEPPRGERRDGERADPRPERPARRPDAHAGHGPRRNGHPASRHAAGDRPPPRGPRLDGHGRSNGDAPRRRDHRGDRPTGSSGRQR
jgi:ATP-dependent RNA helicase RhlE